MPPSRPRAAPADPDATRRVMDALRRLVRALGASARGGADGQGITGAQRFVLRQIAATPGLGLGELAARTLTGQSTVSEVVARLVERGLVARTASPADARQAVLTPTARGRRAAAGGEPTAQERLAAALAELPPDARDALAAGLEAWLAAAGLAALPADMFFEEPK